ncbi:hypothetical protein [Halobaculum sp. EA56]|uniref:hypothetical protein n=1 Tax=Halobaculum sp. EA56 TaxID=3421648 RepID=UPI003EBD183A
MTPRDGRPDGTADLDGEGTEDRDGDAVAGPRLDRRRFLAAVSGVGAAAATGLAGCLGGGTPSEATDAWRDVTRGDPPGTILEGRAVLRPGQYAAVPISWPESEGAGLLSGRIVERLSLPLDVHTLTAEAFEAYRAGEALDGISAASAAGGPTVLFRDTRLPHGEYTLVVDNTRLGGEPPYDELSVGVELSLEF